MSVVVFNSSAFIARYPEFAMVNPTVLQMYFDEATVYCNNTDGSLITEIPIRTIILNAVTAHVAQLATQASAGNAGLVGRIGNATEGSVSVGTVYAAPSPGSRPWFDQTTYGASAWVMMSPYRRALYIPPPCGGRTYVPR